MEHNHSLLATIRSQISRQNRRYCETLLSFSFNARCSRSFASPAQILAELDQQLLPSPATKHADIVSTYLCRVDSANSSQLTRQICCRRQSRHETRRVIAAAMCVCWSLFVHS